MEILDGRKIANGILEELRHRVGKLSFVPLFCDVLVGEDPVSLSYVQTKGKAASRVGMDFKLAQYPADITQDEIVKEIERLNETPHLCGLIVQLPLPAHIDRKAVLEAIRPVLDVDCLGGVNNRAFYAGEEGMKPPTAAAIMEILKSVPEDLSSKRHLVIGQGELVGKPVAFLLREAGRRVTAADKMTANVAELIADSDVIVSATGKPNLVTGELIKPGAIIVDAGTAESDGGIVGDVDFTSCERTAGYISPVPGGVGPVTVAKLLENVVSVAEHISSGRE